jgi:hypothetical protein
MSRTTYLIAVLLGVGVCAVGGYFIYSASGDSPVPLPSFTLGADGAKKPLGALPPLAATRTPPAGFLEYRNTKYRFSLFYPTTLAVKSYDEGLNSSTIVFQNPQEGLGFQVFIVPYGETQVTQERFLMDEPSGVRTNVMNVHIDGVLGTAFEGRNLALGTTSEVWFIKDGYLFEVVSPQVLAGWLASELATWKFI